MDLKKDRDYENIIESLRSTLRCRSFKIIAIDGWPGVGKTTLGRFLANYFDISLIETDLFLEPSQDKFVYKYFMIEYAIQSRRDRCRPVFVEGSTILRTLSRITIPPTFSIYIKSPAKHCELPETLLAHLLEYSSEFRPEEKADFVFESPVQ